MRYLEVGGARVSRIGLGCWQFGSNEWGYGQAYAGGVAGQLVRRALDLGMNLIDTAEIYGFGLSEKIVGGALGSRRPEAFLATKLFPVLPLDPIVRQRARSSLRRLRTDVIDLYQVHWPNPLVPIGTTMAGLRRLIEEGRVRHAGVSNFRLPQWLAADAALGRPVLSNQVRFSLLALRPLLHQVPFAQREDRMIMAYSPLAQGLLSGRYDGTRQPVGVVRRRNPYFMHPELYQVLMDSLREVAAAHQATPSQVALAWLIRHPNVVAIPGASSLRQLEENAAAAEINLSDDEAEALLGAAMGLPA